MSDIVIHGDSANKVKYDLSKLNSFVRQFDKRYILKVGILGEKNGRGGDGPTNAEVGATHEFGSYINKVPMRSFLRMPLHSKADSILAEASKGSLELLASGRLLQVFQNIGIACVGAIQDAFMTKGFGSWKPLKAETIMRKIQNNPDPLINTRQLERAVTFKVEKK